MAHVYVLWAIPGLTHEKKFNRLFSRSLFIS